MKDERYVMAMLKRAVAQQRNAKNKGDEQSFLNHSAVIRNLKIVLDIKKTSGGKNRLKKTIDYNNSLI